MSNELEQLLIEQQGDHLQRYAAHLLQPDTERTLILTVHAVIEQLLGEMIATRLPDPDVWLNEADFRSRTNLARALGMIGESELNICRVLNTARNNAAHGLKPLAEKWRAEILRLGARVKVNASANSDMQDALRQLVALIAAPWLYARVGKARHELIDQHSKRWQQLMAERLREQEDLLEVFLNAELGDKLRREVDEALARELRAASKIGD